jgi:hypothetical protein
MGISLSDPTNTSDPNLDFDTSFWNWRAIVEAVRSTGVLDDAVVNGLHQPYCGNGLSVEQARLVAAALRDRVISKLAPDDWLGQDQTVSKVYEFGPKDGFGAAMKRGDDLTYMYQTNRENLERFATYCESCNGFVVD